MSRADVSRQVFSTWIWVSEALREGNTREELPPRDLQAFGRQGATGHARRGSRGVGEEGWAQPELAANVASRASRAKVVRVIQVSARNAKALPRRPP